MRLIADDVWATLTIWQEARGETHHGRLAVAEVIRNRTAQRYSSDGTIAGTVLRAYQFSGWNTKDPNRGACAMLDYGDPIVADCFLAWREAQEGSNLVRGALLYFARAVVAEPDWVAHCDRVATIGRHEFYLPKAGA